MNKYKNVNETFASNHTKSFSFGIDHSNNILLNRNIKMVLIIIHVVNVVSEIFCLMRTTVQLSGVISRYSIRSKVPRSQVGDSVGVHRCRAHVSVGHQIFLLYIVAQMREDNLTLYYELLCHSGRTVAHSCNIVKTSLLLEAPIEVKILVY